MRRPPTGQAPGQPPKQPAGQPAGLGSWRNAIIVAFALGGFALSSWGTRLPRIREQLAIDNALLGALLACATVGSVVGLALAPVLSTRLGSRHGILGTLLVASSGLGLVATAAATGSVPIAAVGLTVSGFGIGATDILINIDGAAVERRAKRTLLPLMHAAWPAGAVLGALLGAACGALGIAPEVQLTVQGLAIAATGLALTRWLPGRSPRDDSGTYPTPDPAADPAADTAPEAEAQAGTGAVTGAAVQAGAPERRDRGVSALLAAVRDPRLLLIGVVMLASEVGEGAANNWLAVAAHQDLDQPEWSAAALFGIYAGAQVVARLVSGPLVDRFGRVAAVRVTNLLGVLGIALFVTDLNLVAVIAGAALWSIGVSVGFPLGISAAAEGSGGPTRITVVAGIGYLANFVGPPVIGLLSRAFGTLDALWTVAALFAVAALVAGGFDRRGAARES